MSTLPVSVILLLVLFRQVADNTGHMDSKKLGLLLHDCVQVSVFKTESCQNHFGLLKLLLLEEKKFNYFSRKVSIFFFLDSSPTW